MLSQLKKYCKSEGLICNFAVLQSTVINGCVEEPTKHSPVLFVVHVDFFNQVETLDSIGSRVFYKYVARKKKKKERQERKKGN